MLRLGLLLPLTAEAKAFGAKLQPGQLQDFGRHLLILSGMGQAAARMAGQQLVRAGAEALLSVGTAGALRAGLHPGDLCLPTTVLWRGQPYAVDLPLQACLQGSGVAIASAAETLWSSERPLDDPHEKKALAAYGALVDMESGALAAVAQAAGLPLGVARVIVDTVDTPLPGCLRGRSIDPWGRPRWQFLLPHLVRHPQELPALLQLGRQMSLAQQTLASLGQSLQTRGCI